MLAEGQPSVSPQRIIVGRQSPSPKSTKPEITVERTGTLITKVIVKCCCSEEIVINCHYETEVDANA